MIVSDEINDGHGLHFSFHGVEEQLQNVVKDSKYRCGDNNTQLILHEVLPGINQAGE